MTSIKAGPRLPRYLGAMQANLIERYGGPVPRYTSYPTAPHFHAGVDGPTYGAWLAALPAEAPVSLYFHVPFCARMCWYCGCHTKVVNRPDPVHAYAGTLAAEVDQVADTASAGLQVSHVHWGGGTPTILSPPDFTAIMAAVRNRFEVRPDAELAVEIDPRTLSAEMASCLAAAGINRVSLGIQDFNPRVQRAINRIQTFARTRDVIEMLRRHGIRNVNFDLMYGLPHQGLDEVLATVDRACDLQPNRISLFGYAHVPWMKSHQKMIDEAALPDGAARWEQAEAAAARLTARGYRRIGFDHFARTGDPLTRSLDAGRLQRNFQGYTDDNAETLLGFGASSIGSLPCGYVQNEPSVRAWRRAVEAGRLPVVRGRELAPEDHLRRRLISRLICDMAVDLAPYRDDPGAPSDGFSAEIARLQPLADDGLVDLDGAAIRVTETGRPFVRNVCAVFDTYLETGAARHSRAV